MRWHVATRHREDFEDPRAQEVERELPWLGLESAGPVHVSRLFLVGGDLDEAAARRLATEVLADGVCETFTVEPHTEEPPACSRTVTVCRRPGVTEPWAGSIARGAARLGLPLDEIRCGTAYRFDGDADEDTIRRIAERLIANDVIEEILVGTATLPAANVPGDYTFQRVEVPLPDDEAALVQLSRDMALALDAREMKAVKSWFVEEGREPTDIELETIAQTWSEHCKHKTFGAVVRYEGRTIDNLLKSTVFKATKDLDRDFCVSVFVDNAGIIRFDDNWNLCFKVETHNHPSAIEPYGGAGTGIGGVIRDILGTGLGGKPVANTDVFCVGHLDTPGESLPKGVTHPLRILKGVVSGVRDYGNRMGIPTVNGAVIFDDRYVGNPLVYAGTVGIIPRDRCDKKTYPGDVIVAMGGRTGRDGIHGATFSSMELHEESEELDGGAVQIGDAIVEKRCMDVLLQARDLGLYRNVTDCGAGGFSSAVGEMGETTGARVELDAAPLKYPGLSYREIWISEAQERMVVAAPPERLDELLALCEAEDVEACVLGEFTDTGRLEVRYGGETVCDMDMEFLHDGVPRLELDATWSPPEPEVKIEGNEFSPVEALRKILGAPNVASKEWIVRQYDHEVQAGSAVKPLVGVRGSGPGDASVIAPILGSTRGFAVGCGINPHYADLDPYHMACAVIDESVRNIVAVGGDPDRTAILDNFSWGNTQKPDRLGALVRASEGCYDAAMALRTPFISGKDSLNNEYQTADGTIVIPHTLLVSALAIVEDVRECVTMDMKKPGNAIYLVGTTRDEMGASHHAIVHGRLGSHENVPKLDMTTALSTHRSMYRAIRSGTVRACHDCSEGGLAAAVAEMAFAGDVGAEIDVSRAVVDSDIDATTRLFAESLTRYVVEVGEDDVDAFEACFDGVALARIGSTTDAQQVVFTDGANEILSESLDPLRLAHEQSVTQVLEGDRTR